MNLERLLRSPLMNALLILLVGTAFLLMNKPGLVPERVLQALIFILLAYVVLWTTLVLFHNHRYPDRRIRLITYIPTEFREEDEGQQWINYRVTRRVYMLYCGAIPLVLALVSLAPDGTVAGIVSLTLLGALQQVMYWWELRKWEKN